MKSTAFWISSLARHSQQGDRRPQYPVVTVPVFDVLKRICQNLTGDLFSREPVVTTFTDDAGQVWWKVSIPASKQVLWFVSEDELRIWLDHFQ